MAKVILPDDYRAVIYTDGATSPNPGPSGSSMHGYIYNVNMIDQKTTDKPTGYSITNKGYMVGELKESTDDIKLVKPSYYVDGVYIHNDAQTNNVAELQAIAFTIDNLIMVNEFTITNVLILSDSAYAIGVFKKVQDSDRWETEKDLPNRDYYELFRGLIEQAKEKGMTIDIDKVKGHDVSIGNNIADRLAVTGRLLAADHVTVQNEFNLVPSKQYWGSQLDRHPLLKYKQIFFINNDRNKEPALYSVISYKTGIELGKKSPEPIFGTFMPKQHIKEIEEAIRTFQTGSSDKHILLGTVDLSVLYNQRTSHYYNLFGSNIYNMNPRRTQMLVMDEEPVVYAVLPSGLPMKTMEAMMEHRGILSDYQAEKPIREYIDITSSIYGTDEKGKTICKLEPSADKIDLKIKYLDRDVLVPLSLGVDMPDRNVFKKLEKNNVKVSLAVEVDSETTFTYYIIIDDKDTDDLSIWCNLYSNKIVLEDKKKK